MQGEISDPLRMPWAMRRLKRVRAANASLSK